MTLEVLQIIFSGLTVVSIFIAFFSFRSDLKKQREDSDLSHDKEILEQAKLSLEWSFESLSINEEMKMVDPNRLNWLTSARHIQRYYSLRDSLRTNIYKTICSEHEEFWRHKFYLLFSNPNYMFTNYFTNSQRPHYPENIELRSAMIISIFSQWSNETVDPINEVKVDDLISQEPFKGNLGRGIRDYSEHLRENMDALK